MRCGNAARYFVQRCLSGPSFELPLKGLCHKKDFFEGLTNQIVLFVNALMVLKFFEDGFNIF